MPATVSRAFLRPRVGSVLAAGPPPRSEQGRPACRDRRRGGAGSRRASGRSMRVPVAGADKVLDPDTAPARSATRERWCSRGPCSAHIMAAGQRPATRTSCFAWPGEHFALQNRRSPEPAGAWCAEPGAGPHPAGPASGPVPADAGGVERRAQHRLVALRVAARERPGADVDEGLDAGAPKQRDEVFDRAVVLHCRGTGASLHPPPVHETGMVKVPAVRSRHGSECESDGKSSFVRRIRPPYGGSAGSPGVSASSVPPAVNG